MKDNKIIIAFDGPDNVGKGTQIHLLRKSFPKIPFVLMNLDRPVGTTDEEKRTYGLEASRNALLTNRALLKEGIPQIIDRMHYTEYAYSILRGGHEKQTILDLEEEFSDLKKYFFTIIFIDEVSEIQKRDDGLSEYNEKNYDEIKAIQERFIDIAKTSHFDNIVINIHTKSIKRVQSEVETALKNRFPHLFKQKTLVVN